MHPPLILSGCKGVVLETDSTVCSPIGLKAVLSISKGKPQQI